MQQVQFNCLLNAKNEIKFPTAVNIIYYDDLLSIDRYNLFMSFSPTGWIIKPFFSASRIIFSTQQIQRVPKIMKLRRRLGNF